MLDGFTGLIRSLTNEVARMADALEGIDASLSTIVEEIQRADTAEAPEAQEEQ